MGARSGAVWVLEVTLFECARAFMYSTYAILDYCKPVVGHPIYGQSPLFLQYITCLISCCCSYQQHFDLEGESGVVVRGIGTAVTVSRVSTGGRTTSPNSGQDVAHSEFPPTQ